MVVLFTPLIQQKSTYIQVMCMITSTEINGTSVCLNALLDCILYLVMHRLKLAPSM